MAEYKIYELQNIGKGVIESLDESNFLLIKDFFPIPTLDQVMYANGGNVDFGHLIYVNQYVQWLTQGDPSHRVLQEIIDPSYESYPLQPLYRIGAGVGVPNAERALAFYKTKTVFSDTKYNKGLEYDGDYEANFTDRSLITKQYLVNVVRELTVLLGAWQLDRQYSITTVVPPTATIIQVVPFLKCIAASDGYTAGDIINAPTPERNDSGGLSPQGIGIQFRQNSPIIKVLIDGRLSIKKGYVATINAPVIDTDVTDPTKWEIMLSVLFTN